MNPNDLTAAQLLDATIDAMEEAGPEGWCRQYEDGDKRCVIGRAHVVLGGGCIQPKLLRQWDAVVIELFGIQTGPEFALAILNDTARNFDDLLSKLRQIKSAL